MKSFIAFAALALGVSQADAASTTVNFDELGGGQRLLAGAELSGFPGFTLSTTNANGLALYNSSCGGAGQPGCTGDDADLAVDMGLVLINSDGVDGDIGDDASGGIITFDFDRPTQLKGFTFIDLDEAAAGLSLVLTFAGGGSQTVLGSAFDGGATGNGSFITFSDALFSDQNLSSLAVDFNSNGGGISGAIGSLTIAPVPVPAALPLMAFGIGALVVAARRKSAQV